MQMGERGAMTFHGFPVTVLVQLLSMQLGRTVVDKTGLTGTYDFSWQFTPDMSQFRGQAGTQSGPGGAANGGTPTASDPEGTSLFTALQEQLGLKLEAGKGPVEIIVIDHIEKPSEN